MKMRKSREKLQKVSRKSKVGSKVQDKLDSEAGGWENSSTVINKSPVSFNLLGDLFCSEYPIQEHIEQARPHHLDGTLKSDLR